MTAADELVMDFDTTSKSVPEASDSAEPLTIGDAEAPAVVTGIHVPSPGCKTLPRGRLHSWAAVYVESTYV